MAFGNATKGYVKKHSGGGGGGGTTNYNDLSNQPQINGVTLTGNKTSEDLHITGGGGLSFNNCTVTQDGALVYIDFPKTANILFLLTRKPNYNYDCLSMSVPIPFIAKLIEIDKKIDLIYYDSSSGNIKREDCVVSSNGNNYRLKFNNSSINVIDSKYC